jgi:hypothetical protein
MEDQVVEGGIMIGIMAEEILGLILRQQTVNPTIVMARIEIVRMVTGIFVATGKATTKIPVTIPTELNLPIDDEVQLLKMDQEARAIFQRIGDQTTDLV